MRAGFARTRARQGLRPDDDIPPLREILRAQRLVEVDRGFVPVQNIQFDGAIPLLSCNLGHLSEKRPAYTMAAKRLADEEVRPGVSHLLDLHARPRHVPERGE